MSIVKGFKQLCQYLTTSYNLKNIIVEVRARKSEWPISLPANQEQHRKCHKIAISFWSILFPVKPLLEYCRQCPEFYQHRDTDKHPDWTYISCSKNRAGSRQGIMKDDGSVIMRNVMQVPFDCIFKLEHLMKYEDGHGQNQS